LKTCGHVGTCGHVKNSGHVGEHPAAFLGRSTAVDCLLRVGDADDGSIL